MSTPEHPLDGPVLSFFDIFAAQWPFTDNEGAIFIGRSAGTDFKDACRRFFSVAKDHRVQYVTPACYDPETNSYAGLPLFDRKDAS